MYLKLVLCTVAMLLAGATLSMPCTISERPSTFSAWNLPPRECDGIRIDDEVKKR